MKVKNIAALCAAVALSVTMCGCGAATASREDDDFAAELPGEDIELPNEEPVEQPEPEFPAIELPKPDPEPEPPKVETVNYISVNSDGVNIRSGSGVSYPVVGTAERKTLYAMLGEIDGWYKTYYKNKTAYISKKYCVVVEMESAEEDVEAVIAEGTKCLGVPYVYGAVRLHDGSGRMLSGFTKNAFDCSSLMQYMFYNGADKLLQVNTRTQIKQGTTVSKAQLKRGDLIFFTNASRKNNKGLERVGHVAIYLGDNYILHTASDYAKIEQISSTRWSYYIQTQRMF